MWRALGDDSPARTRKTLKKAAGAFGHAGRLASTGPVSGCLAGVAAAAWDARARTLCVRECVAGRRR